MNTDPLSTAQSKRRRLGQRSGRVFAVATAAVTAVLLVAGCSSSSKSTNPSAGGSGNASSTGGKAAQGITASTITIGIDAINSGPIAPAFAGADQFLKAWFSAVNASGGIAGRQIKTIELDSAGDPGQTLSNYKTLWEQDHVAAIIEIGISTPDAYVRSKSIPTFTNGAGPEDYAAANSTVFPMVGTIEAWAAEAAYFLVNIAGKHPTSVGVLTTGTDPEFDSYIKGYWAKLGVTKVDLEPGFAPGGSCSADVLKWKSLNVDYIDMVNTSDAPACLKAEAQLGWKPSLGQGGIGTSSTRTAEQVGAAFDGILGGAPVVSYLGPPIYTTQSPDLVAYVANVKKYVSADFQTPIYLNSAIDSGYYSQAQVITQAFTGALKASPNLTTSGLVDYVHSMTNIQTATLAPIKSMAADCKSGSDGTVWGYWHYDAATKTNTYVPESGNKWISTDYIGGECYLAQFASKLFPNG